MIPSAKIDNCSRAPPEKRLKRLSRPPELSTTRRIATRSPPGVVTKIPSRYTPRIARVKRSRLRSSGIRNMLAMPLVTMLKSFAARGGSLPLRLRLLGLLLRLGSLLCLRGLLCLGSLIRLRSLLCLLRLLGLGRPRRPGSELGRPRRLLRRPGLLAHRLRPSEELNASARLLDGRASAGGDAVRLHGVRALELALPQHHEPVALAFREARPLERGEIDHRARRQLLQAPDLHLLQLPPEDAVEAELRQAALERHLAALEPLEMHVTGARLLALGAAAGGLAEAAGLAATDALALAAGALRPLQLAE